MKYSLSFALLIITNSYAYGMDDKMRELEQELRGCITQCTTEYLAGPRREQSDANEPATLRKTDYCVDVCTTIYKCRVKTLLQKKKHKTARRGFVFEKD